MKFLRVQILRFVAVTAVVAFHAIVTYGRYFAADNPGFLATSGQAGVDLFFVISGFIIRYTIDRREQRPGLFMRRRIERIVPLYWLFTLIVVILLMAGIGHNTTTDPGQTAKALGLSLGFLTWTTVGAGAAPIVYVGWTLEFEMLFYSVTALALLVTKRPFLPVVVAMAGLVVLGCVLGGGAGNAAISFLCSPMLLEFLFGWLIAETLLRGSVPWVAVAICMLALATVSFADNWNLRIVLFGVPSAVMVAAAVWFDRREIVSSTLGVIAAKLGDASYSTYLLQVLTVSAIYKVFARFSHQPQMVLVTIVIIAVTLVGGYALYTGVERPALRLMHRGRTLSPVVDVDRGGGTPRIV